MLPRSADLVVKRTRHSCLDGVRGARRREAHLGRQPSGYTPMAAPWPALSSTSGSVPGCSSPTSSVMHWTTQVNSWQPHARPKPPCLVTFGQTASLTIRTEYERAPTASLGVLNHWPGRSGVPIEDYLHQWDVSCTERQATPELPTRLREILHII
jgi:hypothetical protein